MLLKPVNDSATLNLPVFLLQFNTWNFLECVEQFYIDHRFEDIYVSFNSTLKYLNQHQTMHVLCTYVYCQWLLYMRDHYTWQRRRWRSGFERSPHKRTVGYLNPSRDRLSTKNRLCQLHCQTLGNRCERHGSSEMTIINECPVSQ